MAYSKAAVRIIDSPVARRGASMMMMPGVEKQRSGALTSAMLGAFRVRPETGNEFLGLVNQPGRVGLNSPATLGKGASSITEI